MLAEPFRAMDPDDEVGWHAVADWLEEHDSPQRAELVRLTRLLRNGPRVPDHERHEGRLRELLAAGVEPCVATRTNGIGMEFVYVPPGVFLMGSPEGETGRDPCEGPVREVEIARGFWMGRYPVTQAEYRAVTRKKPSHFSFGGDGRRLVAGLDTSRFPVENVSHDDALAFCEKLPRKAKEAAARCSYRLPTEAEWEYACRGAAGSKPFSFGDTLSWAQAKFDRTYFGVLTRGRSLDRTCQVGNYGPNAFGLHDMHGNVWEWCADRFAPYDGSAPVRDPAGPVEGAERTLRGGSWHTAGSSCRSASRGRITPSNAACFLGFRLILVPDRA